MSDAGNVPSSVAATALDALGAPDRAVNGHLSKDGEDALSSKVDSEAETVIQSGRESISSEKKREYIKHERRCSDGHSHGRDHREAPSTTPAKTAPPSNARKRRRIEQFPLETTKDRDRPRSRPRRRLSSPSWSSTAVKMERTDESRSGVHQEDGAWVDSRPSLQELDVHRRTRSSSAGIVDDPASRGGRLHPTHHHHHHPRHSPPTEDLRDPDRDQREPPNPPSTTTVRRAFDSRSLSPPSRGHRRTISGSQPGMEEPPRRKARPLVLASHPRPSSEDRQSISSSASGSPMPSAQARKLYSDWGAATSPAKQTTHKKQRDQNGRTRLARACAAQEVEVARARHAEHPEDLNVADNAGNTPLQIAALEGCAPIVKFLLDAGCEVDTKNIDRDTPLIDAVENGHLGVIKLLLDAGANPRVVNALGDEPYELVPSDSEDYDEIRRILDEARTHPPLKRRSEEQSAPAHSSSKDPSSRGASAASPRDSPPPARSPPPPGTISRRRTVRSEATRNDLLWTKATPENLREFAAKGDMAGVANILNVGQKADAESLIAAAKGGHDEVMQLLLGIGYADPDPPPLQSGNQRPGFNTPMLAAIGRGNLAVIRLLLAQPGFNPTRRLFRDRPYHELSRERKGVQWEEEAALLKDAFDHAIRVRKSRKLEKLETKSPRRPRDKERERERDREREREKEVKRSVGRGSVSPPSQRKPVRSPTSSRPHHLESLPKETGPSRGKIREESSSHQRERFTQTAPRVRAANRDDHHSEPSVAASDVDLGRFELPHRKTKVAPPGRRQSDCGAAARGDEQVRRRRLIPGRPPHDRDQRRPSLLSSDSLSGREEMSRARADRGSWDAQMAKQHPAPSSLKRSRSSLTPNRSRSRDRKPRREPEDSQKKKRRVLSEDHTQNIATGSAKKGQEPAVEYRSPRTRPRDQSVPDPGRAKSHQAATSEIGRAHV